MSSPSFDSIQTFLFDCDGVLWNANVLFPGIKSMLKGLDENKKNVFFITNNSTKSREDYVEKFKGFGISVNENQIFCTAYASAVYLAEYSLVPPSKKVYVVGCPAMGHELDLLNVKHIGIGREVESESGFVDLHQMQYDPDVVCVLVGFDPFFCYKKVAFAANYVRMRSCPFVATNRDTEGAMRNGFVAPGTDLCVTSVEKVSKVSPKVVGKPEPYLIDLILRENHIDPAKAIIVGDNLLTDIKLGSRTSIRTLLVLSGVTSENGLEVEKSKADEDPSRVIPDFVLPSAADILHHL